MSVLGIAPSERRPLALLAAFAMTVGIGNSMAMTAGFTLFFERFEPRHLPWIYLVNAGIAGGLGALFLAMSRRLPQALCLRLLAGFILVAVAIAAVAVEDDAPAPVAFALPLLSQVMSILWNLALWGAAGQMFDLRQGKRLFGLVAAGFWLGYILTGLLVKPLVALVGVSGLYGAAVFAKVGALAVIYLLTRLYGDRFATVRASAAGEARMPLRAVAREPYVLLIFAVTVMALISFYVLDNVFYQRAKEAFPDAAAFASFFGFFVATMGGTTLVGTLFGTRPLIQKLGVPGSLALLPAVLVVITLGMAVVGGFTGMALLFFGLAIAARLVYSALYAMAHTPAQNLLYQPLPLRLRAVAQQANDGLVQPLTIGISGVILLVFRDGLDAGAAALAWLALATCALWTVATWASGRLYRAQVVHSLEERRIRPADPLEIDGAGIVVLQEAVKHDSAETVAFALTLLERAAPSEYRHALPPLLFHAAEDVRRDVLARIEQLSLGGKTVRLIQSVVAADASPAVRARAIRTLAVVAEEEADLEPIIDLAQTGNPADRQAALVGLLRRGDLQAILVAVERLTRSLAAHNPAERILAAEVIAESELSGLYRSLRPLLTDRQVPVRRAALAAAARIRARQLWPQVSQALDDPATRRPAMRALAAGGAAAIESLSAVLQRRNAKPAARIAACQALGRIADPRATAQLLPLLEHADEAVRAYAIEALQRQPRGPGAVSRAAAERLLDREIASAAEIVALLIGVKRVPSTRLLADALEDALGRSRSRAFRLLAFLHDREVVHNAAAALGIPWRYAGNPPPVTHDPRRRASAVEAIEMLAGPARRQALLALIEDMPDAARLRRLAGGERNYAIEDAFARHIAGEAGWLTPWIRACALFVLPADLAGRLATRVEAAAQSDDPLVKDTARRVLQRLGRLQIEENHMLSTLERILLLKASNFFAGLGEGTLSEIGAMLVEQEVARDAVIVEKGAHDSAMYLIAAGRVGVYDGPLKLAELERGQVFGEMALLDPGERSATVRAEEDSRLLRLDGLLFQDLLEDNGDMAQSIIRELVRRLRSRRVELRAAH